jgi:PAS domain S-box-containing protein
MTDFPLWSFVHLCAFIIYTGIIVIILSQGSRHILNRVSAVLFIFFAGWSFGQIFIVNPQTPQNLAFLFNKINAISWCAFPAFALWFTLIVVKKQRILASKIFYFIITVLPVVFIYLHWSGRLQTLPAKRYYGWHADWIDGSIWAYLFYIYFAAIMVHNIVAMFIEERKTASKLIKHQMRILILVTSVAFLIGLYFEIILPSFKLHGWDTPLSDISDICIAIWALGILYATLNYRLFTITPATASENIISAMSEALFLTNEELNVMYANNAAYRLLDYNPSELSGRVFVSILQDKKAINELLKTALTHGSISGFETLLARKNGGAVPVLLSVSCLIETGDIKGFACIATDITDRKISEIRIKQERDKAQKYLDIADIIFLVLDKQHRVALINKKGCEILGYRENEIIGKDWLENFVPADIKNDISDVFGRILEDNAVLGDVENRILAKNGRERLIRWSNTIIKNELGEISGVLSAGKDITEQSRAQEQIEKLSVAVEQSPGMIIITDPDGAITYVNPKFTEITGYSKEDALGNNPRILKSGEMTREQYKGLWDTINSGREWRGEFHNKKKNGSLYWELASISPIKNQEGEITNFIAIKEDITAQKKNAQALLESYEKLKELDVLKTNFTSMVSHELRTPLTSIKGFLTFLLSGVAGKVNAQQKEYLEIINNNSERLLALINDILDISKMESGTFTIEKRPSDIIELLSSSVRDIESIAKKKNITISVSAPAEKVMINMDPYRISQALINLINNAVKFSHTNSEVQVALDRPGLNKNPAPGTVAAQVTGKNYIRICVKDTGIGIKKENLNKIFNRYYQVENINTRHAQGTGLGLNICRNIIEAHSGAVWVESAGEGKGAVFCVLLPG